MVKCTVIHLVIQSDRVLTQYKCKIYCTNKDGNKTVLNDIYSVIENVITDRLREEPREEKTTKTSKTKLMC